MALNNSKLKKKLNIKIPSLMDQFDIYFNRYRFRNI